MPPSDTSSRHAAVPPSRDEGGFTSPIFDPPKDGFAACSRMLFGVANRRPEFRGIMVKQRERLSAFTLLEILLVIGIIAILMVLIAPAFTSIKTGNDVTTAANTIKGVLDQARTYAMANNTYTWVGFYEESPTASTAPTPAPTSTPSPSPSPTPTTNATPPYPGKGRLVLAIVASKDGTIGCEDPNSTSGNRIPLTASLITQVGKIVKIENIHVTDIGPPPSPTPSPTPDPSSIDARSGLPYYIAGTSTLDPLGYQSRINSDDANAPYNQALYPFVAQAYEFYKTIRFSPRGEPSIDINGTFTARNPAEIGLVPTHSNVPPTPPPSGGTYSGNVVAIQLTGMAGNVKIYRR